MKNKSQHQVHPLSISNCRDGKAIRKKTIAASLCSVCGAKALYVCSACKLRRYCCHLHQKQDWRKHRMLCGGIVSKKSFVFCTDGILSYDLLKFVVARLRASDVGIIDGFNGQGLAQNIFHEVKHLYFNERTFTAGTCLSMMRGENPEIRGDDIAWVSGSEQHLPAISEFVDRVNRLASSSARYLNCKIAGRSQVMLSCFPGQGSCYKLHIDNPCKTGHILAAQLFLNGDYDPSSDGGLLRVQRPGRVVDIEPKLDRLVLHWADERTPHEVLPAYKDRFSITVWYTGEYSQPTGAVLTKGESGKSLDNRFINTKKASDICLASEGETVKNLGNRFTSNNISQLTKGIRSDASNYSTLSNYVKTLYSINPQLFDPARRKDGNLMTLLSLLTDRSQAS